MYDPLGGWTQSAEAWILSQGDDGDASRRDILDPALEQTLGDVRGLNVLDVGCGEGRYSRLLAKKGARVTGLDPVTSFIERARSLDPDSRYVISGGEAMPLESASFDIVISYLSLVDIPDYVSAIQEMARVLDPAGKIIVVTVSNMASTSTGWIKDGSGAKIYRAVDRYMDDFAMDLEWANIRIVNYHRPLSRILRHFFDAGVAVTNFVEPLPSPASPFFTDEQRVPTFQIMEFKQFPSRPLLR